MILEIIMPNFKMSSRPIQKHHVIIRHANLAEGNDLIARNSTLCAILMRHDWRGINLVWNMLRDIAHFDMFGGNYRKSNSQSALGFQIPYLILDGRDPINPFSNCEDVPRFVDNRTREENSSRSYTSASEFGNRSSKFLPEFDFGPIFRRIPTTRDQFFPRKIIKILSNENDN